MIKEIKKQINRQTRPKVGNVKIDTQSSVFREKPIDKDENLTVPVIIWDKTYYNKNRNEPCMYFDLNPTSFNSDLVNKSYTTISTLNGSFRDASIEYGNVRYSGWAGIQGGGVISFKIIAAACSVSIWVDGNEIISGSNDMSFMTSDINLYISDKSFIQIFWYSETADNTFQIVGDIAKSLHLWEQSDVTPFMYDVEWYTPNPIESGTSYFPLAQDYIVLRWWFGGIEYNDDETQWEDLNKEFQDLGGFGIYSIDFTEIGTCVLESVIGGFPRTKIKVYGNHTTVKYIRTASGNVVEPRYSVFAVSESTTWFYVSPADALLFSTGEIVEKGQSRHLRDIPYVRGTGNPLTTVFSVVDNDVEWNQTYYYVIDPGDGSKTITGAVSIVK